MSASRGFPRPLHERFQPERLLSGLTSGLLMGITKDYRQGLVPLTLLQHHLRRHPVPDRVWEQVYLRPYPKELMLTNHV